MAFTRKSKNPVRYEYPGGRDLETQQLLPELLWNILFPVNAGRLPASWLASVQANALLNIPPEVKSRPPKFRSRSSDLGEFGWTRSFVGFPLHHTARSVRLYPHHHKISCFLLQPVK
jgi:hypothetical protein